MNGTEILAALWQSPVREILLALGSALLTLGVERVRQRLSRNEALTSEAAKVRLAAYGRVLAALSPVAALVFMASVTEQTDDEDDDTRPDDGLVKAFDATHEKACRAVMAEYLLIGATTSRAMMGFLGFTDRLFDTLKATERTDPRRAEVLSKVGPMIESVEKVLPRFAQLPREHHFRQQDLAAVYTEVGIWAKRGGTYEIVNPGE